MRGGAGARQVGDGWVSGSDRVRVLSGLVRMVTREGDLHADDDSGVTLCRKGLLITFVTVLGGSSAQFVVYLSNLGGQLTVHQGIAPSPLAATDGSDVFRTPSGRWKGNASGGHTQKTRS
jgi:hypothetical protein